MNQGPSVFSALLALSILGCNTTRDQTVAPGTGTIGGTIKVKPRRGVVPGKAGTGVYADAKMRGVKFVGYKRVEYAVIYYKNSKSLRGTVKLTIKESQKRSRILPALGAIGVDGQIVIRNTSQKTQFFSCPELDLLASIEAGGETTLSVNKEGKLQFFLFDGEGEAATVFAAPGAYTVPDNNGDWRLRNLKPGRGDLVWWSPRFPLGSQQIKVIEGQFHQLDLIVGVENLGNQ
jgi:hypothetical protein